MDTSSPNDRLRLARVAAGFKTAKSFAESIGVPQPTYSMHESGARQISLKAAETYTKALKNCTVEWLLLGIGKGPVASEPHSYGARNILENIPLASFRIVGVVEPGAWRESPELPIEEQEPVQYEIRPEFQGARRFGMRVAGSGPVSQVFPPGTVLDCIAFEGTARRPQSGDNVIIYRDGPGGLIEATVREIVRGVSGWILRSTAGQADDIQISTLSTDPEPGVRIVAFVIGAYRRLL